MRKCSDATLQKIATVALPGGSERWLKAAVSNARNGYPMSYATERRMCEALGIEPPRRKAYYRPCLPTELGAQVRASGWDIETIIVTGLAALPWI